MIYNDFQELKLSALGMGAMRLPVIDGDNTRIDEEAAAKMIDCAMAKGINYYDTAWGYHGGNSEPVMGRALSKYPRESFYLATKFPGYDLSNFGKVEEIFEKQLERCGVDYFDFYLFHNVNEMNIEHYLDDETYGTYTYLMKQKENGRIRHLGFSAHGKIETVARFLEKYGKDMEFCQIQLNWVDWSFQDAKGKIELLEKYNLPVWVMEPLRGGKLAKISSPNTAKLKKLRPDEDVPAWSFRFLQSLDCVKMTLSGMSNEEQLMANIETYETNRPLNEEEMKQLLSIGESLVGGVPCTSCRYCTSECPQGLNIPELLYLYNEFEFAGGGFLAPMRVKVLPEDKRPAACVGCRSCEAVCPQNIKISEVMEAFAGKL